MTEFVTHLFGADVIEPGEPEQVAEHAQDLPRRPRLARRSRGARDALPATFHVDPGAGGLGEDRRRQDDRRVGADVVAGLVKMASDRFPDDVPPHWSVTFAVDDAEATAARAEELGGALVAPPMDAGPTRITVVRDPQGAVFTASRFYSERL